MTEREDISPSPENALNGARRFEEAWAAVALFGTTISVAVAIAYSLLRLGLSTPPLLPLACVLIVAAALFGPLLVPYGEARFRGIVLPLISFALLGSIVLSFWAGPLLLIFYFLVSILGLVKAGAVLIGRRGLRASFWLVVLGLIFAVYLFVTVHSMGYAGVNTPEQAFLGTLNHDTTIHSAIAFMVQNFGVPSLGLDGIVPVRYHYGSHVWFAALGALAGAEPVWSYGAGVPIVCAPLLVTALVLAVVCMDGARKSVSSHLLLGLGIILLSDMIGWKSYYISESYTFGLIGLLLLMPLLAELAKPGPLTRFTICGLALAVAAIPILVLLKTSVGILWCVAFGWVVLRRFGLKPATIVTGVAAVVVLGGILWASSPGIEDYRRGASDLAIRPFYLFVFYPDVVTYASLVLPVCLVLSRVFGKGAASLREIVRRNVDPMLEAVILVTIIGTIPSLTGVPQDSAVWYFLNVAQWMAMVLLVVRFAPDSVSMESLRSNPLVAPALVVVTFLFLAATQSLYPKTFESIKATVAVADEKTGGAILNGRTVTQYFVQTLLSEGSLWGADFRAALADASGYQVREIVRNQVGMPARDMAVFVPPSNSAFWDMHPVCLEKHNVQASLTGLPSLFGGIPASYNCAPDAYVTAYTGDYLSREGLTDADLCSHAAQRQIRRVFILAESRPSDRNRVLDCAAPG